MFIGGGGGGGEPGVTLTPRPLKYNSRTLLGELNLDPELAICPDGLPFIDGLSYQLAPGSVANNQNTLQ